MVRASSSFRDQNRESTLLKPWAGEMAQCVKALPHNSDVKNRHNLQGQYPSKNTNQCLRANNCYQRTLMCTMSTVSATGVSLTCYRHHFSIPQGMHHGNQMAKISDFTYRHKLHALYAQDFPLKLPEELLWPFDQMSWVCYSYHTSCSSNSPW